MKGLLKMKLNENFLIHKSDTGELLIPIGEETKKFHGVVKLNDTGAIIAHLLEDKDMTLEEILDYFYKEYPEEDKDMITKGVSEFINKLKEINAITY